MAEYDPNDQIREAKTVCDDAAALYEPVKLERLARMHFHLSKAIEYRMHAMTRRKSGLIGEALDLEKDSEHHFQAAGEV